MGQISMEISPPNGSLLSGNQQIVGHVPNWIWTSAIPQPMDASFHFAQKEAKSAVSRRQRRENDLDDYDFSIVIPTFNSQAVVEYAISSIKRQTGISVQVIVVDGVSQDETCEIVRNAALPSLVLVSEPDAGIYDAINKGVALAQGRLIGVLGSDDRYFEGALRLALDAYQRFGTGIVAGRTSIAGAPRADEPYGVNALMSGIPFGHNAMFATRAAYNAVGQYDLRYRICADADWVHRAIRKGVSCKIVDADFVEFGTGGESSTQSERIMEETYTIIASNFPGITIEEAQRLLFASRRWAPATSIADIASRHANNAELMEAISAKFPEGFSKVRVSPSRALGRALRSSCSALTGRFRQ